LYGLLIAPLSDDLAAHQQLIVVPHGALHYLPFHALYDGTSFLLEEYEISYLPAASLLRYCQRPADPVSGQLVYGRSHHGRLPYAVQEALEVASLLGAPAFLEGDATLARLREAAPGCRVIHLATHGAFRADSPLFSGLALADGWLSTLDVFDLRLAASLVVLSACQTGRNVVGGGDELLGLMRAFLYAGAASVLLSQWAVQDQAAAQLMESFYGKLMIGWPKGAALQHAQRHVIGRQGEQGQPAETFAHPYFWAPFFLVGDTRALQSSIHSASGGNLL
jgi:CHAT domain-containing protein